jgi:hypothetical protein
MPDSPDTAFFLTDDEKLQARQRLETVDRTAKSKVNWKQIVRKFPITKCLLVQLCEMQPGLRSTRLAESITFFIPF